METCHPVMDIRYVALVETPRVIETRRVALMEKDLWAIETQHGVLTGIGW